MYVVFIVLLHLHRIVSIAVVVVIERRGIGRRADMWINMCNAKYIRTKADSAVRLLCLEDRFGRLYVLYVDAIGGGRHATPKRGILWECKRTMWNVDRIATRSGCILPRGRSTTFDTPASYHPWWKVHAIDRDWRLARLLWLWNTNEWMFGLKRLGYQLRDINQTPVDIHHAIRAAIHVMWHFWH